MRSSPFLLARPRRSTIRRVLTGKSADGATLEFPFEVRTLEMIDEFNVASVGRDLIARYVTVDAKTGLPQVQLPPVGGEEVMISESTCMFVAALMVAQCGEPGGEFAPWDEQQIIAMLVSPEMLEQLTELSNEIGQGAEVASSDPLSGGGEQSSATASPSE